MLDTAMTPRTDSYRTNRRPGLRGRRASAALAGLAMAAAAQAGSYDEATQGELSDDRLAPTRFELSFDAGGNVPGSNILSGRIGRSSAGVVDRDYVHLVVPAGFVWTELRVGNRSTAGGSEGSFIGLAAGRHVPVAPTAASAAGLLGWTLYGPGQATTDILDDMARGHAVAGGLNGASGFNAPLPAGDYALWIQELAPGSYPYRFNLLLSPVPEPASLSIAVLGLGLVLLRQRRRRAMRSTGLRPANG
jgi:hypothetical protein